MIVLNLSCVDNLILPAKKEVIMKGHNVQIYFLNSSLDLIFALSESKSLLMKARSEPTFLVIQMRLEN